MKTSHTVHKQQISLTQKNILAGRDLATLPDIPDIRDRYYEPALIPLKAEMAPRPGAAILDQGTDGACTGFGLAAVINALLAEQGIARQVSPWMLYEMARCHDEWPGESYVGSSPRGALRGWANNGVCPADLWDQPGGILTPECAKAARDVTIGAYYRLRPELVDFHAALNECGVLYVSAAVHPGWEKPRRLLHDGHKAKLMTIIPSSQLAGYHAFAVVGYNDKGFWVQNSWGSGWGDDGVSLWLYEDWAANIQDAWVVRLALATPQMFGIVPGRSGRKRNGFLGGAKPPTRADIAGHFVHIDDGDFCSRQPYWSNENDADNTAGMIKSQLGGESGYRHLLIYAHGGLNSAQDSAERTRALAPVLKANGIYPFMVMYDTGFGETLKDLIFAKGAGSNERAGGVTDLTDLIIEKAVGGVGARMWREMKEDAGEMFKAGGAGSKVLTSFMTHLADDIANKGIKLHFVGHSLGSVLIGHLLQSFLSATDRQGHLASLSLMAPACQTDFFNRFYADDLNTVDDFAIYNLSDQAELADNVGLVYRKSLLYLVSNAFEDKPQTPLAGMDKFRHQLRMGKGKIHIASESSKVTRSSSHGGFDNDPFTLNHLMGRVLGQQPKRPFTAEDLDYSGFPSWPSHFGTVVRAGQSGGTGG